MSAIAGCEAYPVIVNVVDLGSNSFQWLVARCAQGRVERLHQQKRFARFASSVALTGRLSETDIERGVRMVADLFAQVASEYRCETTLAVATGAIRQASNGLEFIQRLQSELGLEARILRGEEEAELAFRGALSCIGAVNNEPHAVLDLGGGSLELGVGTAEGPDGVWSVQRGMLHYLERFERAGRDGSALRQAGQEVATAMAQEVGERQLGSYPTVVLACGVARDLTALLDTIPFYIGVHYLSRYLRLEPGRFDFVATPRQHVLVVLGVHQRCPQHPHGCPLDRWIRRIRDQQLGPLEDHLERFPERPSNRSPRSLVDR